MNQYANSSYLCFYVSCCSCKCNCRKSSSHCKSAMQFASQKYVSLITEKFLKKEAANDLLQWPNSPEWHIFAHLLDCSIVPPCADWGSAAIGLSACEAETWNSLAHALTEFRIGKRILVDDLRSFRRRRSKQGATLAASGVKLPVIDKMSAFMVARLFNLDRDMRTRVLTNPSNYRECMRIMIMIRI